MEIIKRLYVDTNILIALGEGTDDISNLLYSLVDSQAPDEQPFLCTSELSLAELLVRPYREQDETLIQLYDNWIQRQNPWLQVGPVDHQTLWYSAVLRASYRSLKLPDAIHLATAIGFECSHFLTADTRIQNRVELFHERRGIRRGPAVLDVVRPDAGTLKAILESRIPS
jgi:predicted nucleic acid-binding protein